MTYTHPFSKLFSSLIITINLISSLGADQACNEQAKKRVILTNQLTIIIFVLGIITMIGFIFFTGAWSKGSIALYIGLFIISFVPILNKHHFEKISKLLLLLLLSWIPIFSAGGIANTPEAMRASGDWQFVAMFVPILLFESYEIRLRILGIVFVIASYFSIYAIHPWLNSSTDYNAAVNFLWHITSTLALLGVASAFILSLRLDLSIIEKSEAKYKNLSENLDIQVKERTAQLLQSEKLSSIGQMVAGVAHEVNTPRATVDQLLVVTNKKVDKIIASDSIPEIKIHATEIKTNVLPPMEMAITRIGVLTDGLLNFTRKDHKEMKASDLHQILDSVIVLLRSQFHNGIHIVKEYGTIPKVVCYPGQINQVFMNILTNAAQAMPDAGGDIAIKTWQENHHVNISIMDTGSGMSEETKKKIFDPFFTTKEVGKGTGLGMAIVWDILQKHRAAIDVKSELGKGTTFCIGIPLDRSN
ncbi:GHKL domain-containing protein [bacterium]|nr:GHKL domain-containing protein [bacterium]